MATVPEFMKMLEVLQVDIGATNLEFEHCDRDGGPYGRVTGNTPADEATERRAREVFLAAIPGGSCEFYEFDDDLFSFELEWTTEPSRRATPAE